MREYIAPDFDIIVFEMEDIITLSIGNYDPNKDSDSDGDWWG